ncbi:class II glutamine amidotransferase [Catenovulum maritimum]|uniref:Glutamine amidotransferase type-2 domain-containing protein n=1 Tax=Catenovulum maritimum TaxID=1513271 RepID=A0A0J8GZP1_9ALTE|nr:class II glutamine amidotransferase [Catenovulum maritimum]KMT66208.1 hypothetical protein XM47_04195 [Catenovulum maritimum]
MCRFLAYSGPTILMHQLILDACHSLVFQSKSARKTNLPVNGDGFGIAWYPTHLNKEQAEPIVFLSVEPAWRNRNLEQITRKLPMQHCFAHIRDANGGSSVNYENCHPFQWKNYLWMHNGLLDEFEKIKRPLQALLSEKAYQFVKGSTDSEYAFALFLDCINWQPNLSAEQLKLGMFECMEKIMRLRKAQGANTNAFMNFAVTNGVDTIATRFSSLASEQPSSLFAAVGEVKFVKEKLRIEKSGDDSNYSCIIASEPLTSDKSNWKKIDRNCFIHSRNNKIIEISKIPLSFQSDLA